MATPLRCDVHIKRNFSEELKKLISPEEMKSFFIKVFGTTQVLSLFVILHFTFQQLSMFGLEEENVGNLSHRRTLVERYQARLPTIYQVD